MTHAAARILHVATLTRNYVQVEMRDRLSCRTAFIEADIEAVRRMRFAQQLFGPLDCNCDGRPLTRMQVGPIRHMAMRRDEQMPWRNWKGIPKGLYQRLDKGDPRFTRKTKGAGV